MRFKEYREGLHRPPSAFKVGDKITYAKGAIGHAHGTVEKINHKYHHDEIVMRITKKVGKYATQVGDVIHADEESYEMGHV